jgi:hypothetical protein
MATHNALEVRKYRYSRGRVKAYGGKILDGATKRAEMHPRSGANRFCGGDDPVGGFSAAWDHCGGSSVPIPSTWTIPQRRNSAGFFLEPTRDVAHVLNLLQTMASSVISGKRPTIVRLVEDDAPADRNAYTCPVLWWRAKILGLRLRLEPTINERTVACQVLTFQHPPAWL